MKMMKRLVTAVAAVIAPIVALATATPPSVTSEAILWLDAAMPSTLTVNASGQVTRWDSRVGSNYAKAPASGLTYPTFDAATYGIPTVDFGVTGSNKDLLLNSRMTTIRTVFLAVKIEANINAFWLGDSSNTYDFHRGTDGAYANATTYGAKFGKVWNGLDEVANFKSDIPDSSVFNIVTLQMNQNTVAGSLTRDRTQSGRNGGRQLSELIVFSRTLTDAEREDVIEYLQEKWIEKDVLNVRVTASRTDSATEFSRDGGESWGDSLDFVSQYNSDVVLQARNTQTAGCYFDWSGLPADAVFLNPLHTAVSLKALPPTPIAVTCRSIAPGGVNAWTGASGDFEDGANWSLGRVPCYVDDVVLTAPQGVTNTVTALSAIGVGSLSVGGTGNGRIVLMFKNGLTTNEVAGAVHVYSGGYITHYGPSDNLYHLNLRVGGNMTIEAGGYVDSRAKGFGGNRGITATGVVGSGGSFGCHGGRGQNKSYCYGNIRNPFFPGMGGYVGRGSAYVGFGLGGGVICLDVLGSLVVNGEISSDAGGEYDQCQAGGSVVLRCASLSGSGRIAANPTRSKAGGGRIAIYQSAANDLSFGGLLGASGGSDFARSYKFYYPWITGTYVPRTNYYDGSYGAGTIYIENADDPADRGTLLVRGYKANNALQSGYTDISALVADSQEPFGEVIVTNGARVMVRSGCTLKVQRKLDTRGGELVLQDNTAFVEFVGNDDLVYLGSNTLINVKCTVPGKKIYFGAPSSLSKLVIPAGGSLVLTGTAENPVSLLPTDPAEDWWINADADASQDVSYIAVSNCNASAGTGILAIDSADLGGNQKWSFSSAIVLGATNEWTGAVSADWGDGANWSLARQVQDTDVAYVPAGPAVQPSILSGIVTLNEVIVESGASLTLAGECDVTVTNNFTCAGALNFTDKEKLTFTGSANLTGATVSRGLGRVYIVGEGAQTVNLGGCGFYKVIIRRPGGSLALNGGFSAHELWCNATAAAQSIAVGAGTTIAADEMYVNGLVGSEQRLTIGSSVPGAKWYLKAAALDQCFTGVMLSDCDASGGATVVAGASSTNVNGSNVNFDFTTVTANWVGGDGYFDDAAKWVPAAVPGTTAKATIYAEEGETFTVTVRSAASVGSLAVTGTDDSAPTFLANAAVEVEGDFIARTNATLVLNAFSDYGAAPNTVGGDFCLRNGARLMHTGPASSENAKVHVAVSGDMLVEAGAAVDVTARGYTPGYGPGYSGQAGSYHASHGGCSKTGICYGSMLRPIAYGSGTVTHSGDSIAAAYRNGGQGGGSIMLEVAGDLAVDGDIKANGAPEYDHGTPGGSILIHAGTLSGSGRILAQAGNIAAPGQQGYGGGGRIAVYQAGLPSLSRFSGTISTCNGDRGGAGTCFFSGSDAASAGTELRVEKGVSPWSSNFVTQFPMTNDYVDVTGQTPVLKMLTKAYANVNVTISNAFVSVTNISAHELWDMGATIRVRDLNLVNANAVLRLNGCTIEVLDYTHKNGKGWYSGSYEAAVAAGKVVLGEVNGVPGKVVWRRRGLSVTLR